MKIKNRLIAGTAKAKLTPERNVYLGGYSDSDNETNLCRIPEDILGDVFVRVLFLECNGERMVFVVLDGCVVIEGKNIPAGTREKIATIADTSIDSVLILNTHNHQSLKRFEKLETTIIENTVRQAMENRSPCRMSSRIVTNNIGVNRRPKYGVSPELPFDNRMILLKFDRIPDGKTIGLVYNYPIHNTALGNSHPENWHYLSSELTGFASLRLDHLYGGDADDFTAIHLNGFYGASGPNFHGVSTAAHAEIIKRGGELGDWIAKQAQKMTFESVEKITVTKIRKNFGINKTYGENAVEEITFYAARIGAIAILGVDCEPFSEIGAIVRSFSPFKKTILLANANGFSGYIPTYDAFHCGAEERECRLNKTPYVDSTEQEFITESVCLLAKLSGHPVCKSAVMQYKNQKKSDDSDLVEFIYELPDPMITDRLILVLKENILKAIRPFVYIRGWDETGRQVLDGHGRVKPYATAAISFHKCAVKRVNVGIRYRNGNRESDDSKGIVIYINT